MDLLKSAPSDPDIKVQAAKWSPTPLAQESHQNSASRPNLVEQMSRSGPVISMNPRTRAELGRNVARGRALENNHRL
jgi:hypothetical protein